MTERGLPSVDGAPACPFVAFEDDREARATSPDHRHRCYAELVPSTRAAAHQEAYCLSSAFPVCPTFQDWARREAAHARGEGERPRSAPTATPESAEQAAAAHHADADGEDEADASTHTAPVEEPTIRRNPPRDWAAPPPWAPGGSGAGSAGAARGSRGDEPGTSPSFAAGRADESRGLAGSAADRLAGGSRSTRDPGDVSAPYDDASSAPDEELAGLVVGRRPPERPDSDYLPPARNARRPSVSSTRTSQREREREREHDAIVGPSWERARRFEAYPTIRARAGLPAPPRLVVLAGALLIAAIALFFLPALLGVGGGGGADAPSASPSASRAGASASPEPSASAAPTQQVYVVAPNDTMSKIAAKFGFTLAELCEANKDAIPNCDKIKVGDEVFIPAKAPDQFTDPSPSAS